MPFLHHTCGGGKIRQTNVLQMEVNLKEKSNHEESLEVVGRTEVKEATPNIGLSCLLTN